jgi:hypothetical protein
MTYRRTNSRKSNFATEPTPQLVTSPEDLEALECAMRQRTDRLGSLLVGHHMQQAVDAAALQAEQERLVANGPRRSKATARSR